MLKFTLIILAVVVIGFLIVVAMQPSLFRITRSATIGAPQPVVFAQVNDFHNWEAWSPWAKLDPTCKNTYVGPPSGTGAGFGWSGNKKVGEGRMTILESRPSELIRIKLEFVRPFAGTSTTEFTFQPQGNQTLVAWTMTGTHNFVAKAFCMFMNMGKTVGGDFEKGLAGMKRAAESAAVA